MASSSFSAAWWEQVNSPNYPESDFKRDFRMSRATFEMICHEVESEISALRQTIPVRQRVAVCIYTLATGYSLRKVSKLFGIAIPTCHKLVLEVCNAIGTVLMPKHLKWPDEERMAEIKSGFETLSRIPNVCGSMYTTHVPIAPPNLNTSKYINQRQTQRNNNKMSYTITVQGVVDPTGVFTDIFIGWPGSMSDVQILENSALWRRAHHGVLKDNWIVGGMGYPLMDWLLVPYAHPNLTWRQHTLNEKVEGVRGVAKGAFMRLKARWGCLSTRPEMQLQELPVLFGACCVLHNICEMRGEGLAPEMRFNIFEDEVLPLPHNQVRSVNAMHVRDQIAHNLLHCLFHFVFSFCFRFK